MPLETCRVGHKVVKYYYPSMAIIYEGANVNA